LSTHRVERNNYGHDDYHDVLEGAICLDT